MTDFRLALQGGGANFITLLAAAKAIYDLHHDDANTFRLEKVSGTSAGSIAAAILALDLDPALVRRHLIEVGTRHLNTIVTMPQKGPFLREYREWGMKALSVATGDPFLSYDALRRFIDTLLTQGELRDHRPLSEVTIPLTVATTDLRHSRVKYWSSAEAEARDKGLATVVADSCSIPGVFKSLKASGEPRYVDGGLIENLPLAPLLQGGFAPHRVIGMTLEREDNVEFGALRTYFGALLSAVIGSNVDNSMQLVPGDNLIVLPRHFGTLDFQTALSDGLEAQFELVRQTTDIALRKIVDREERRIHEEKSESRFSRNYDAGRSAERIYETFRSPDLAVDSIEIEWTLNSLRDPLDAAYSNRDPMVTRYTIARPKATDTLAFRIWLYSQTDQMSLTLNELDVSDENGVEIAFTDLVGTPKRFDNAFIIPVYLYIDLTTMADNASAILIRHIDYIPDEEVKRFNDPKRKSDGKISFGLSSASPGLKQITMMMHLPTAVHERCDFRPLAELDEKKVPVSSYLSGELTRELKGNMSTPLNFTTVRWRSVAPANTDDAAGFDVYWRTTGPEPGSDGR